MQPQIVVSLIVVSVVFALGVGLPFFMLLPRWCHPSSKSSKGFVMKTNHQRNYKDEGSFRDPSMMTFSTKLLNGLKKSKKGWRWHAHSC